MVRRISALLLTLLLLLSVSAAVYAAGGIEIDRETDLTVSFIYEDGTILEGAVFALYKVADISGSAALTISPDFEEYGIDISLWETGSWQTTADTLEGLVQRDGLQPLATAKTDAEGNAAFASLGTGLYLVICRAHAQGGHIYYGMPFLICLPRWDGEDWIYSVTAAPKMSEDPWGDDIGVTKIWEDKGAEDKRPESVTIDLLCDGEVVDTAVLSADNSWRHSWSEMDPDHQWTVAERNVPGYTVRIERNGSDFVVINSREAKPTEPEPSLPQTGVLWWPVPVLAMLGMVMLLIGWRRGRVEV